MELSKNYIPRIAWVGTGEVYMSLRISQQFNSLLEREGAISCMFDSNLPIISLQIFDVNACE